MLLPLLAAFLLVGKKRLVIAAVMLRCSPKSLTPLARSKTTVLESQPLISPRSSHKWSSLGFGLFYDWYLKDYRITTNHAENQHTSARKHWHLKLPDTF